MTLREKIGQLIFSGFQAEELNEDFINLVNEYKIGNVILFSNNIKSALQTRELCDELQKLIQGATGQPALISIDQEGGMVVRLKGDCTNMPGAMAIAATNDPKNAFIAGEITARELRTLGINVNLAPTVDVNSNPANPVIGVRSYGDDPQTVSRYAIQAMEGLKKGGVMSVLKHFPGHGDTAVDSHLALPKVDKTLEELMLSDLIPFVNAIKNGAESIMTSHILFPKLETENKPATMSKTIITGLLRGQLGFKGIVMSDCLEMNAIKDYYGTAKGALEAIKAGVDMVFISHSSHLAKEAVLLIEEAVNSGELSLEILDEAVARVHKFKLEYTYDVAFIKGLAGCKEHREEAERISKESMALIRDTRKQIPINEGKVLFVGSHASHITNVMSLIDKGFNFPDFMSKNFGGEGLLIPMNPEEEDLENVLKNAEGKDVIVFGTYNGHIFKGQLDILNKLCEVHPNVIAVALRNPYDLGMINKEIAAIATYEYTPLSLSSLVKVLKGEVVPGGRLCVKI